MALADAYAIFDYDTVIYVDMTGSGLEHSIDITDASAAVDSLRAGTVPASLSHLTIPTRAHELMLARRLEDWVVTR